jgi:hypothetical protein
MADEKTDTTPAAAPVIEEKSVPVPAPALPDTIQLSELETLRLASSNNQLGRMVAETRMLQMQIQQTSAQVKQYDEDIQAASQSQQSMLAEVGVAHGVGPAIRRYTIDLKTGVCSLKKAPQPKG